MKPFHPTLGGLIVAGLVVSVAACSSNALDPSTSTSSSTSTDTTSAGSDSVSTPAGTLRVSCERQSDRSRISVDANNLSSQNRSFSARVLGSGGTASSPIKVAVGDEVEFDFDSNRNDIAAGATPISATFIEAL